MLLSLNTPVNELNLVGPAYAKKLTNINIKSVHDLLYHAPHRYQDYSQVKTISQLAINEITTFKASVVGCKNLRTRMGKTIQKAFLTDQTGTIEAVWFNQPFLTQTLKTGALVSLAGTVSGTPLKPEMISPEFELIKHERADTIHTGRLVPVYPETRGLSSKWLRSRIAPILKNFPQLIEEWLPPSLLAKENLLSLSDALTYLHFPANQEEITQAKRRLAFDEMFSLQLLNRLKKNTRLKLKTKRKMEPGMLKLRKFIQTLPFSLTTDQKKAIAEITQDLIKTVPMNRLLQGDVGCGKTVVAAAAAYLVFLNRGKTVLMAPTEILALQHANTLKTLLSPYQIKIALFTGVKKELAEKANLIIGTHALLHHHFSLEDFDLVIIDEQHRFGVSQRTTLVQKGGAPHVLTMTATPIPRSVALTVFGDLDLSSIRQMPPGRQSVKTWLVPPQKRQAAYHWIADRLRQGDQIFIVCPLIEESPHETLKQVKAAADEFQNLREKVFSGFRLGLLHGRLKSSEKEKIINNFRQHELDILVATPVVEVGIDIQNATVMVIEGSERFGLAQLHQLRGRVGRGQKQSYCLLFTTTGKMDASRRLKALTKNLPGFELAELDLQLRGPGELYGIRQHGFTDLKFTSFTDYSLIAKTQAYANLLLEKNPGLTAFPKLLTHLNRLSQTVEPN